MLEFFFVEGNIC